MKLNGHISQPDKRTSGARASGSERSAYHGADLTGVERQRNPGQCPAHGSAIIAYVCRGRKIK